MHQRGVFRQQERVASDCRDVLEWASTWWGQIEGMESAQRPIRGCAHVGHLFSAPRAQRELEKIQSTRLVETSQHHQYGFPAVKTRASYMA